MINALIKTRIFNPFCPILPSEGCQLGRDKLFLGSKYSISTSTSNSQAIIDPNSFLTGLLATNIIRNIDTYSSVEIFI
jgi:hypothetical protein